MAYHLSNEPVDHTDGLKDALKNLKDTDADLILVSDDGKIVETKRVLFSMHSKVLAAILSEFLPFEVPRVTLPTKSSTSIQNLVNLLIDGAVLSTESETLYETGQLALLLGIKLDGLQLGRKKKSAVIGNVSLGPLSEPKSAKNESEKKQVEVQIEETSKKEPIHDGDKVKLEKVEVDVSPAGLEVVSTIKI